MKTISKLILSVFILFSLFSCNTSKEDDPKPVVNNTDTTSVDTTKIVIPPVTQNYVEYTSKNGMIVNPSNDVLQMGYVKVNDVLQFEHYRTNDITPHVLFEYVSNFDSICNVNLRFSDFKYNDYKDKIDLEGKIYTNNESDSYKINILPKLHILNTTDYEVIDVYIEVNYLERGKWVTSFGGETWVDYGNFIGGFVEVNILHKINSDTINYKIDFYKFIID